jgi:hypothetical protein
MQTVAVDNAMASEARGERNSAVGAFAAFVFCRQKKWPCKKV